jgi:hypothetical protein
MAPELPRRPASAGAGAGGRGKGAYRRSTKAWGLLLGEVGDCDFSEKGRLVWVPSVYPGEAFVIITF